MVGFFGDVTFFRICVGILADLMSLMVSLVSSVVVDSWLFFCFQRLFRRGVVVGACEPRLSHSPEVSELILVKVSDVVTLVLIFAFLTST